MSDLPLIFLVAGEVSGDMLGARLMRALKSETRGAVRFAGVGGARMEAEGLRSLFPLSELAHMGLFELARHLPRLFRRLDQTVEAAKSMKPVALVTIDAPDFSFRVAKRLRGKGMPLIHYVAPSVWAWRPGRAKKAAARLDHLMALLPFEPPYFTREGLACTFVGHPVVESGADRGDAARFRARFHVPEGEPLLVVLPGSRFGEVRRMLPVFAETVARLRERHDGLRVVVPTVEPVADEVAAAVKDWPLPVTLVRDDGDKYDAFAAGTAALACSGTVAVELAMARLPGVIAYRMNAATAALARRLLKIRYASLVNLMHDRMVMPELLQERCTADALAETVGGLLADPAAREAQIRAMTSVAGWLGQGQFVPSERAARTVLECASDYKKASV